MPLGNSGLSPRPWVGGRFSHTLLPVQTQAWHGPPGWCDNGYRPLKQRGCPMACSSASEAHLADLAHLHHTWVRRCGQTPRSLWLPESQ